MITEIAAENVERVASRTSFMVSDRCKKGYSRTDKYFEVKAKVDRARTMIMRR